MQCIELYPVSLLRAPLLALYYDYEGELKIEEMNRGCYMQ